MLTWHLFCDESIVLANLIVEQVMRKKHIFDVGENAGAFVGNMGRETVCDKIGGKSIRWHNFANFMYVSNSIILI